MGYRSVRAGSDPRSVRGNKEILSEAPKRSPSQREPSDYTDAALSGGQESCLAGNEVCPHERHVPIKSSPYKR